MSEVEPGELMARLPQTLAIFPLEGALLLRRTVRCRCTSSNRAIAT